MKRAADTQLTREGREQDDDSEDQPTPWKKASDKELARRNIKPLPKRRGFSSDASPTPESAPLDSDAGATGSTLPPLGGLPSLSSLPSLVGPTALPALPKLSAPATFTFKAPSPAPVSATTTAPKQALPSFSFGPLGTAGASSSTNASSTRFSFKPTSTSTSTSKDDKAKEPGTTLKSLLESYRTNPSGTSLPFGSGDPMKKSPSFGSEERGGNGLPSKGSGTFGINIDSPLSAQDKGKGKARMSPPKSPLKSPNDDRYGLPHYPDETEEVEYEEGEEGEEDEEGVEWVDPDDFQYGSGFAPGDFEAEFYTNDIDVGMDPGRPKPYMSLDNSSYNAQYKYWIHMRGLNNSFVRAVMDFYKKDKTGDIGCLFAQYDGAKRRIEKDFVSWAKGVYGEEAVMDEFDIAGYDDEEMEDGEAEGEEGAEGEGGTDGEGGHEEHEVIEIDDEDDDKTPPAQPKPKSPPKSPEVSKSKPKSPTPTPASTSTGFTASVPFGNFTFAGKTVMSDSFKTTTGDGGGFKPTGFTFPPFAMPATTAATTTSASSSTTKPSGFTFKPNTTELKSPDAPKAAGGFVPTTSTSATKSGFSFGAPSSAPSISFGSTTATDKPAEASKPPTFGSSPFTPSPAKPSAFGGSSFPGFGPITGGPSGSPFGTKAAADPPSAKPGEKSPNPIKPLGSWPGSTPDAGKPGGLFGLGSGSFGSTGTGGGASGFSFGAPPAGNHKDSNPFAPKEKEANPFSGSKMPIGGSFDNSNPFHVTTGPTISLSSLGNKERAGFGLPPLSGDATPAGAKEGKDTDEEGDGATTPKAEKPPASPWAAGLKKPEIAPASISGAPLLSGLKPFTFGMGSKPPSSAPPPPSSGFSFADPPPTFKAPTTSASSGFSFADPPMGFTAPSAGVSSGAGGGFSFAEPPKSTASAGGNAFTNPFTSPPKTGSLFGSSGGFSFGGFGAGAGSGTSAFGAGGGTSSAFGAASTGAGGSAPLFGSGSAPSFSFGKAPSTLPDFAGTSSLARGPSMNSTTSSESAHKFASSSQETLAAEPVGGLGEKSLGGNTSGTGTSLGGASQDASTGAGVSQDSDVAPEGGTGLAIGEDKFDQPGPGEEMEESLFNVRGKIMRFSGSAWADLGIGQVRLYRHKETGAKRVFARNSKSGRIILNFTPFAKMEPKIDDQKAKFMRMTAMDDGKLVKVLIKLKEEKDANALVSVLQKEVDALS